MAKKQDNLILELKNQIKTKKAALKGVDKFSSATNCSLVLDGERWNLHAVDTNGLTLILLKLNLLRISAMDLGVNEPDISGFPLKDWISDVSSKLLIVNRQKEETRLRELENQLTALLSLEKKTELLLDDLKSQI